MEPAARKRTSLKLAATIRKVGVRHRFVDRRGPSLNWKGTVSWHGSFRTALRAVTAAYATNLNATTFNPASVSPIYRSAEPVKIRSHVIVGDFLSAARTISNGLPDPSFPNPNV